MPTLLTHRNPHDDNSDLATAFSKSNNEHYKIARFKKDHDGIDTHPYKAGEWIYIRDWCVQRVERDIRLIWGPSRHKHSFGAMR